VSGPVVTVITHRRPEEVGDALELLQRVGEETGATLRFDPEETEKHDLEGDDERVIANALIDREVDLCLVLGGDGTILTALREYEGTGVPVFAVNYGEVGFLATIDPDEDAGDLGEAFERALAGDFEVLTLPALALETPEGPQAAINDVSIHRRAGERVAQLAYAIDGEEAGSVRCDGLVLATPAGSTGYNLANGGPVLAWGVEGFVVSFIAPHSLTARALVVAPGDLLSVHNRSQGEVDISLDGRPAGTLGPGDAISASFLREAADLAQVPGSSFYRRLRQKFGRLAS
jgi:NAD+ kinase